MHTFESHDGLYSCFCGFQGEELEMAKHMLQKLFPHIDYDLEYEIGYLRKVEAEKSKRKDEEIKKLRKRLEELEGERTT